MNNVRYMKNLPSVIKVKEDVNSGFHDELELNIETDIYENIVNGERKYAVTAEFYYFNKEWFDIIKNSCLNCKNIDWYCEEYGWGGSTKVYECKKTSYHNLSSFPFKNTKCKKFLLY